MTAPFDQLLTGLGRLNVLCLEALGALYDVEGDWLAFLKAAEAICLNRREMHENILAVGTAEKAETLRVIKPLNCSLFHLYLFLEMMYRRTQFGIGCV